MGTRLSAFIARHRIPRCRHCGAMVDAKPTFVAQYVCAARDCLEQEALERSLGV